VTALRRVALDERGARRTSSTALERRPRCRRTAKAGATIRHIVSMCCRPTLILQAVPAFRPQETDSSALEPAGGKTERNRLRGR
jgi:hypothetical protein